jgi:hypothetical protein
MTLKENLEATPEGQVAIQAGGGQLEEKSPSKPSIPEKYKGKSIEEIVEMHANAEKKISELGNKVHELSSKMVQPQPVDRPVVQDYSPKPPVVGQDAYYNDPYAYTEAQLTDVRLRNKQLELGMSILIARQDKTMPDWNKYEEEILAKAKTNPVILSSGDWSRMAYELVMAEKLPEMVAEAQEKGKALGMEEVTTKLAVPVVTSERKEPLAPPKPTREDKLAQFKAGKITAQQLIAEEYLSEKELGARK